MKINLKKRRRIEITAFRRQIAIVLRDQLKTVASDPAPFNEDGTPLVDIGAAQLERVDFAESQLTSVEVESSPELALLVEALIESAGDGTRAARRLGLSRSSFYSKLRDLGLSIKRLKTSVRGPGNNVFP